MDVVRHKALANVGLFQSQKTIVSLDRFVHKSGRLW